MSVTISELDYLDDIDVVEAIKVLVDRLEPKMGRCATCRWAALIRPGESHPFNCRRVESGDSLAQPLEEAMSVAPEFGCVMWEAKP